SARRGRDCAAGRGRAQALVPARRPSGAGCQRRGLAGLNVLGLKPIAEDGRRVDPTSQFAARYLPVLDEVDAANRGRFGMIDFVSLQARDLALQHNEAVASYAVASCVCCGAMTPAWSAGRRSTRPS